MLTANGQDLCYLNITLCDESGKTNQQEIKQITVSVDGAGKLQGLGSSNPSNEEDYFDRCCNTFDGDAMACVRAGHESRNHYSNNFSKWMRRCSKKNRSEVAA